MKKMKGGGLMKMMRRMAASLPGMPRPKRGMGGMPPAYRANGPSKRFDTFVAHLPLTESGPARSPEDFRGGAGPRPDG